MVVQNERAVVFKRGSEGQVARRARLSLSGADLGWAEQRLDTAWEM
jgi:hypothetical protein